jgi:hypothetical protein
MKNKTLNICLAIILTFALHSVKAQSVQKKFESDMEQRRKHRGVLLLKAKEQQTQHPEKRNEPGVPQQAVNNNPVQTNIHTITQQKTNEVKTNSKKPVVVKQTSINVPGKKEEINQ